jgi:sialate O-acetylesterase
MRRAWLVVIGCLVLVGSVVADVKLPSLFADGMVIQRETKAPVWGWADPGEKVQISTSWGAKARVTTGDDGRWSVKLKTPKAGGPFTITVTGNNSLTVNDVLAGEVWFCSGQSNMDFPLKAIAKDAREEKYRPVSDYVRNEVETASDPLLRHIEVPNTPSPYEKKMDFKGRWVSCSPATNPDISATAYFFGRELREKLGVPVGLVECAWGGTRIQPWISEETYRADPDMSAHYDREMAELNRRSDAWSLEEARKQHQAALKEWKANGQKDGRPRMDPDPAKDKQWSATLHKGMVSAVIPYAIKGVIWYQGESNAKYMTEYYEAYFTTLIESWRKEWGQGKFPFYWAQLANFRDPNDEPLDDSGWASICDQQRRALKLPNTGMAVLNDIGEAEDIHPRNKVDVGKRLALWALAKDYDIEVPAVSGPLYKSHKIRKDKVLVKFDHVGSGLMVGHKNLLDDAVEIDEPLMRFQIAGADRAWKWADAKIVSSDTVEVYHPDIQSPVIVRYAWSENPEGANLYNREGLPASVFTTE